MIIGIKDNYPLSTHGNNKTARCRLCNHKMIGLMDWNMRFYCEECYPLQEAYDVYPRRIKPTLIKEG